MKANAHRCVCDEYVGKVHKINNVQSEKSNGVNT